MNWILGLFFVLIVIFLMNKYFKKKRIAKLKIYFLENWGKPKNEEYYNFFVIGRYFENNAHKNKAYHIISEKNKIDLDLDDVFKFIDRTSSRIGQQYLYFKLRTIDRIENLLNFNSLTNLFQTNKTLRLNSQLLLSKLNTNDSYYLEELINGKQIEKPKILWLIQLLSVLALVSVILVFFYRIKIL